MDQKIMLNFSEFPLLDFANYLLGC